LGTCVSFAGNKARILLVPNDLPLGVCSLMMIVWSPQVAETSHGVAYRDH
jgi:hypothetical protein